MDEYEGVVTIRVAFNSTGLTEAIQVRQDDFTNAAIIQNLADFVFRVDEWLRA
jgi:hypothetical protein